MYPRVRELEADVLCDQELGVIGRRVSSVLNSFVAGEDKCLGRCKLKVRKRNLLSKAVCWDLRQVEWDGSST